MRLTFSKLVSTVTLAGTSAFAQGTAPQITSFKIESGSFNTANQNATLEIRTTGATPTAYRVSERSDFSGASWKAFNSSPKVLLSSTKGEKIVFLQVGTGTVVIPSPRTSSTISFPSMDIAVPAPPLLSATARDTIVYGLPDLTATVEMPAQVRDGDHRMFDFTVSVRNNGQATPPGQVIHLYNSFVLNQIAIESYDVTFGVSRLVGEGCRVTDVPTIECSLAPIPPGGGVQVKLRGSVTRLLTAGQTQSSPTLRTRITGVAESNMTNNWIDTPLKVVR